MITFTATPGLQRRQALAALVALVAFAWPAATPAQDSRDTSRETLSLYGVTLKDAGVDAFVAAARAAGGVPLPAVAGAAAVLDVRASGVPALERLTVLAHDGRFVSARFSVKDYGQDNEALRRMLLAKYGVPMTVSARPLPAQGFDGHASPRGAFQWSFADGMKLVYEHPRVGDTTLSYVDSEKAATGGAPPGSPPPPSAAPGSELRDRL